jgi:Ca-activated chloride channel homolog
VRHPSIALVAATATVAVIAISGARAQQPVFKSGVDLVNVTATVTDGDGRFISGLTRENFVIYDDGKPQEIVTFTSERVPVSLGMLLDVSGSMSEDRLAVARSAIRHFVSNLLGKEDELFLLEFAGRGRMLQTWTRDRDAFGLALARARGGQPSGAGLIVGSSQRASSGGFGTAILDAVATSLGIAAEGAHTKKALLVLSDGIDTSSQRSVKEVQEAIRRSEILVYALAVNGTADGGLFDTDAVDANALRKLTDDTGGRTEVVKGFKNLDQATSRLADELNQQYVIGYAAPPNRDGRWHTIKVEVVKKRGTRVRARSGYVAS